jgi:hypothetical protein
MERVEAPGVEGRFGMRDGARGSAALDGALVPSADSRTSSRTPAVTSLVTALEDAILAGDTRCALAALDELRRVLDRRRLS